MAKQKATEYDFSDILTPKEEYDFSEILAPKVKPDPNSEFSPEKTTPLMLTEYQGLFLPETEAVTATAPRIPVTPGGLSARNRILAEEAYKQHIAEAPPSIKEGGVEQTIAKAPGQISEWVGDPKELPGAIGRGLAEGLTVEIPRMAGQAAQYLGANVQGVNPVIAAAGMAGGHKVQQWAEQAEKAALGERPEYKGLAGVAYEGSKMLAPSIIPAGTAGAAARIGLAGLKSLNAAQKAKIATNIASLTSAGFYGISTAQDVRARAKEKGVDPGLHPEIQGAIEALGEYVGTRYMAKLLGLDENAIRVTLENFIKTLGVENTTAFVQQLGQSLSDKYSGIRPDARPMDEAIQVIGPTTFMTVMTAGAGKAAEFATRIPEGRRGLPGTTGREFADIPTDTKTEGLDFSDILGAPDRDVVQGEATSDKNVVTPEKKPSESSVEAPQSEELAPEGTQTPPEKETPQIANLEEAKKLTEIETDAGLREADEPLTREQKRALIDAGFTVKELKKMPPKEAKKVLGEEEVATEKPAEEEQAGAEQPSDVVAEGEKITYYRGVKKGVNYETGDKFYSIDREVAEEYAAPDEVGGEFGVVEEITDDKLPKNLYTTYDKESLAQEFGLSTKPRYINSRRFDEDAKKAVQEMGHEGIRYEAGTHFGQEPAEEIHVFGTKPVQEKREEQKTPAVQEKRTEVESEQKPAWEIAEERVRPYAKNLRNLSDKELRAEDKKISDAINEWARNTPSFLPDGTLNPKIGRDMAYFELSAKLKAIGKEQDQRKGTAPKQPKPTATPKTPKDYIIREEPHPLKKGKSVFRAYEKDGTPLYIGEETAEAVEEKLRSAENVKSVTVEREVTTPKGEEKKKPVQPETPLSASPMWGDRSYRLYIPNELEQKIPAWMNTFISGESITGGGKMVGEKKLTVAGNIGKQAIKTFDWLEKNGVEIPNVDEWVRRNFNRKWIEKNAPKWLRAWDEQKRGKSVPVSERKKPVGRTKFHDAEDIGLSLLSRFGRGSISPDWVVDWKTGKIKLAGEFESIDPYFLDKSNKPKSIPEGGVVYGSLDVDAANEGMDKGELLDRLAKEVDSYYRHKREIERLKNLTPEEERELDKQFSNQFSLVQENPSDQQTEDATTRLESIEEKADALEEKGDAYLEGSPEELDAVIAEFDSFLKEVTLPKGEPVKAIQPTEEFPFVKGQPREPQLQARIDELHAENEKLERGEQEDMFSGKIAENVSRRKREIATELQRLNKQLPEARAEDARIAKEGKVRQSEMFDAEEMGSKQKEMFDVEGKAKAGEPSKDDIHQIELLQTYVGGGRGNKAATGVLTLRQLLERGSMDYTKDISFKAKGYDVARRFGFELEEVSVPNLLVSRFRAKGNSPYLDMKVRDIVSGRKSLETLDEQQQRLVREARQPTKEKSGIQPPENFKHLEVQGFGDYANLTKSYIQADRKAGELLKAAGATYFQGGEREKGTIPPGWYVFPKDVKDIADANARGVFLGKNAQEAFDNAREMKFERPSITETVRDTQQPPDALRQLTEGDELNKPNLSAYKSVEELSRDYEILYHGGSKNIIGNKLVTGGRVVGEVTKENLGKGQDYGGIFFTPEKELARTFARHTPAGDEGGVHTFLVKKANLFDETNPSHRARLRRFVGKQYRNVDGEMETFTQQMHDFIFPQLEDGRRHMDWATFDPQVLEAIGFDGAKVVENYSEDGKHLYSTVLFRGGQSSPHWLVEHGATLKDVFERGNSILRKIDSGRGSGGISTLLSTLTPEARENVVVTTRDNAPEGLRKFLDNKTKGIYYNGKVYLFENADPKTFFHELAHMVIDKDPRNFLRGMFGEDHVAPFLDSVWRDRERAIKNAEWYNRYTRTDPDVYNPNTAQGKRNLANEYIAHLSENQDRTTWEKLIAWLRSALRNIAPNLTWTDAELKKLIADGYRKMQKTPQKGTAVQQAPIFRMDKPLFQLKDRKFVAVGIKIGDKVYRGNRGEIHADLLPRMTQDEQFKYLDNTDSHNKLDGFIDDAGQFVSRQEASREAKRELASPDVLRQIEGEDKFSDVQKLPFEEGPPNRDKVARMKRWLSEHSDLYKNEYVIMYHGTGKGVPVESEGLKKTSAARRRSYQSRSGYVYLAATPERARVFGDLGNSSQSKVVAVKVLVRNLKADTDQLNNLRAAGIDVGNTLAESIVYGGGARIAQNIHPYDTEVLRQLSESDSETLARLKPIIEGTGGYNVRVDSQMGRPVVYFEHKGVKDAEGKSVPTTFARFPETVDTPEKINAIVEEKNADYQVLRQLDEGIDEPMGDVTSSQAQENYDRIKRNLDSVKVKILEKLQDNWVRVDKLLQDREVVVTDENNPYQQKVLYAGRVQDRMDKIQNELDSIDKAVLKTAKERGLSSEELWNDINLYLHAKHAPERNAVHGERASGMSDEDAQNVMNELQEKGEFSDIQRLGDQLAQASRKGLEILRNAQLISEEKYSKLRELYPNHVPLNRVMDDTGIEHYIAGGEGFNVYSSGLKRAKGSERQVADIAVNIATNLATFSVRAEKNLVDLATLQFSRDNAHLGLFEEIKPKAIGKRWDGSTIFQEIRDPLVLHLYENGKPVYLRIKDASLARAFQNINIEKLHPLFHYVAAFGRLYSGLATRFNPEFWPSNKIRDLEELLPTVAAAKGLGGKAALKAVGRDILMENVKAVSDYVRGKDTEGARLYAQMKADGGTTGGLALSTRKDIEINLEKLKKLNRSGGRRALNYAIQTVDHLNQIFEDSTRLSVYRTALEMGMTRKQAAFHAKNSTIDFNRKGEWGGIINALYIFSNASIQGSVKMLRAMKNPKVATAVTLAVATAVFLTAQWNDEIDEDWRDKVSKWDRLNGLPVLIPSDEGVRYITIPISWGLKPIKAMVDNIYDLSTGNEESVKDAVGSVLTSVIDAYNPLGGSDVVSAITPTVLDLPVDLARNKTWSGSMIRPHDYGMRPRYTLYFKSLEKSAVGQGAIATARRLDDIGIEVSPADIKYVFDQATGGTGRFLSKVITSAASTVTGELPTSREAPFAGRFYRDIPTEELGARRPVLQRITEQEKRVTRLKIRALETGSQPDIDAYTAAKRVLDDMREASPEYQAKLRVEKDQREARERTLRSGI